MLSERLSFIHDNVDGLLTQEVAAMAALLIRTVASANVPLVGKEILVRNAPVWVSRKRNFFKKI